MDRISSQTIGLIDDIKEWVDLKVQLVQMDVEEKFETMANHIVSMLIVLVLASVTLLFGLTALAFAAGEWLGHPAWGFLSVTVLLAVVTLVVRIVRPRIIKAPQFRKSVPKLASGDRKVPAGQLPEKSLLSDSHEPATEN